MLVCSFVCVWVRAVGLGYFTAPFVVLLRPYGKIVFIFFYPVAFVDILKSLTSLIWWLYPDVGLGP